MTKFPCRVEVAPQHDLRAKGIVRVESLAQVVNLQKEKYKIIRYLDQE